MARIKKGDLVVVIAGRDKGKQGRVLEVDVERSRVVVEGVQRMKRHTKVGQSGRGARTGGIETIEAPIHVSNVMVVDPETKKGTRVGIRTETVERDGVERTQRVRVAKRSGKDI
ncbi:50S ribosomal protein L24 [Georgenia sp. 311]|uniref:Large ribosomal subunit protein uL24 n=1 Tax=Georgenia wutianyii TaxID=2585135 RepID=A0ABX5VRI5_9MICO|nr:MULTISPECIES: 50S ribosomal protein L24 [Georgenia]QDB80246.1 50S ribosomal protein L24 [Georgenia wutianyii]TNC18988.1 50S ribosomal protein L24 [Georgenia sp. 311]